jgi:TolA-binding protein
MDELALGKFRIMQKPMMAALVASGLLAMSLLAQDPAPVPADADAVSQQAAKLEAELGKVRDTAPEAVDAMLQLVDLYARHGRIFGLLRIGQKFMAAHPAHPRHKDVMLQLIDGMLATSRNKDVTATCRQFLVRYPDDPACPRIEVLLARTLDQLDDFPKAAEAHEAVWRRQPTTQTGRDSGIRSITLYASLNNAAAFKQAAQLAEALVEKSPNGEFVTQVGWQALNNWERAGEWAKFIVAGNKLLQRQIPADKLGLRELHRRMAENYVRLGQHANSVESLKKARAIEDRQDLLRLLIQGMYNATAKGAELEPLVTEYFQKYPEAVDRFLLRSLVAHASLRDGDKPKALVILAELLPYEAVQYGNASAYARENGSEPDKLAQSERVLREAIAKNPRDAAYLRYVLGLELARDRQQDVPKARQIMRELLTQSPSNDGYTQAALTWLLYTAPTDAEFQADVAQHLKVRRQRADWAAHRAFLQNWIQEARQNKDHKARAELAKAELDKANQDPFVIDWIATESSNLAQAQAARAKLLEPDSLKQLHDEQAWSLFYYLGYYHRHYGTPPQRVESASVYGRMVQRFPGKMEAATYYLQTATDYAPPEVAKEAALQMLKLEPQANDVDAWYRLMRAADANQDAALARQSFAWINKAQTKFGPEPGYSYLIGDILEKYEMKAEALQYWQRSVTLNTNQSELRQCSQRILQRLPPEQQAPFLANLIAQPSDNHGAFALWLADIHMKAGDLASFEKVLTASRDRQRERPFLGWGMEDSPPLQWVNHYRATKDLPEADRRKVFTMVRDLQIGRPSGVAAAALLELPADPQEPPMSRILAHQLATTYMYNDAYDWDLMLPFAQAALGRKDYVAASTLLTGMLSNIPNIDPGRRKTGQEMVGQSYARMGGTGLAIDENSPLAPLMQAALYLRLGDERLAFESYSAHKALFDEHRNEVPVDLVLFICESHIAAAGDENLERAEDILRNWLVKNSEVPEIDESTKAKVQLMLAKSYVKAQRFDVARGEYTTVINRYGKTPEAIEAEFGIGETFMAQKVYDQAESVFEKLAGNRDRDVVIRAEFLRGVLANRRGDRDEAREIFRAVLDRVPNIELANQALFNLAEVYGAEQRYMDALELLRTVGRLGRSSKRTHMPGTPLSIVVQDSDLGTSQGRTKIPVRVTTTPGGDEEIIYLLSSAGSKGLFRADLETRLGQVMQRDRTLQLSGHDVIHCDYPDDFKAQFRSVPLADAEIRVAADAKLEVSSSKIVDKAKQSFSDTLLEQEVKDKRVSEDRPSYQLKPGNPIYLRVQDADRGLTDQPDKLLVKLQATSGDQVQASLTETGPYTGIFEGTAQTAELPAGALASDTAIEHSPLMAIDQSPDTFWVSEPDGATPKWLSVDMKDLKHVARVTISTPNPNSQAPVRGELQGSDDGRFWFRLASVPPLPPTQSVAGDFGPMQIRVYAGNHTGFTTWQQVVDLSKNAKPIVAEPVEQLAWNLPADHADAQKPYTAIWQGKLVQPKSGAARIAVQGVRTAVMVDGYLELPVGPGGRTLDLWLERGTHDLTIFSAAATAVQGVAATWARADHRSSEVVLAPFRRTDFDLEQATAKSGPPRDPAEVNVADNVWNFRFDPMELRHVRLVVHEYLGEAVAINHIEIGGLDDKELFIPTAADILSLAANDVLEIAGGDQVLATYTDEFTQSASGRSQLLTANLTATYFNAGLSPIAYDFERAPNGAVVTVRKELIRIDPGERFVVEIIDYDLDQSNIPDTLKLKVAVNDGEPIELTAQETTEYSGIFTKEIDTSTTPAKDKLHVKPGDRIYCTYVDAQNTFPGHAVAREAIVYVNQPSEGEVRVLETRIVRPPPEVKAPPQIVYKTPKDRKQPSNVAFEAPLTIEVIDRDAAKDSRSKVTAQLTTTDGAKIEVECAVSGDFSAYSAYNGYTSDNNPGVLTRWALEEGRFIGQVILQLGGKESPDVVPLSVGMPRGLIGGGKLPEGTTNKNVETVVTRVLNVTGKDVISATYRDALRPKAPPVDRVARGRLIANGVLACTDRDYEHPCTQLHVGEKLFVMVTDADLDVSDARDWAQVEVSTERGEKELVSLEETLVHSGIFTGSVMLKSQDKPTPGNLDPEQPQIETYFGDMVQLKFVDKAASTESGTLESVLEVPVVIGTDGLVQAFSKTFRDETLAVETKFHIAESYFELFKSHKKLARTEEQKSDLEAGRRLLREVMEDYPNPKYVPRIAYLLGQFAQELQQWGEAIDSYVMIVRQYPESSLAADAQYKLAQCYEEAGQFDEALEAYVTLAATYPKSPLIANVMIRISDHFYKEKNYEVAAQVGEKFLERFEGHQWGSKMAFRVGQCYYKAKQYPKAGDAFDRFVKIFPEDPLSADSMFWAGESFRMASNNAQAFRRYNRCRWDFPATEAAKYARGRLALPEMLAQFESEANSVEDP